MNNTTRQVCMTAEEAREYLDEYHKTVVEYVDGVPLEHVPPKFWQAAAVLTLETRPESEDIIDETALEVMKQLGEES